MTIQEKRWQQQWVSKIRHFRWTLSSLYRYYKKLCSFAKWQDENVRDEFIRLMECKCPLVLSMARNKLNLHWAAGILVSRFEIVWSLSWVDCLGTWLPVSWANFTMLFDKLESLKDTKGFIGASSNWEIVNNGVLDDTRWINQEKTTESNTTSNI